MENNWKIVYSKFAITRPRVLILSSPQVEVGMLTYSFFWKTIFRFENDNEKSKTKRSFLKTIVFLKVRFLKMVVFIKFVVSLTIINDDPSLTIVNDDPSLTIVNEERKPTWKGICNNHWVVFKKISRSFSSPTTVKLHVRRHSIKLHVIFFSSKTIVFPKPTVFIKSVVLLMIVNDNPSSTIAFFKNCIKKRWQIVFIKTIVFKKIVIVF